MLTKTRDYHFEDEFRTRATYVVSSPIPGRRRSADRGGVGRTRIARMETWLRLFRTFAHRVQHPPIGSRSGFRLFRYVPPPSLGERRPQQARKVHRHEARTLLVPFDEQTVLSVENAVPKLQLHVAISLG